MSECAKKHQWYRWTPYVKLLKSEEVSSATINISSISKVYPVDQWFPNFFGPLPKSR